MANYFVKGRLATTKIKLSFVHVPCLQTMQQRRIKSEKWMLAKHLKYGRIKDTVSLISRGCRIKILEKNIGLSPQPPPLYSILSAQTNIVEYVDILGTEAIYAEPQQICSV